MTSIPGSSLELFDQYRSLHYCNYSLHSFAVYKHILSQPRPQAAKQSNALTALRLTAFFSEHPTSVTQDLSRMKQLHQDTGAVWQRNIQNTAYTCA